MKVIFDEMISPKIPKAIEALGIKDSWEYCSVRNLYQGIEDISWITDFSRNNGNVIISGDANIHNKPHQLLALHNAGLISFFMEGQWCSQQLHTQAAHIIKWWPAIKNRAEKSEKGTSWTVPFRWTLSELEQKKIPEKLLSKAKNECS